MKRRLENKLEIQAVVTWGCTWLTSLKHITCLYKEKNSKKYFIALANGKNKLGWLTYLCVTISRLEQSFETWFWLYTILCWINCIYIEINFNVVVHTSINLNRDVPKLLPKLWKITRPCLKNQEFWVLSCTVQILFYGCKAMSSRPVKKPGSQNTKQHHFQQMVTREVSETGKFTPLGLFPLFCC